MVFKFLKSKLRKTLFVSIIISIIISIAMTAGLLDTWESKISDAFYAPSNPLDEIVIIAIDDKSLQELGRWPWPRDYFAEVIESLNQSSVIGIDISFFESTELDSELASSLKKANVVLAMEYTSFSFKDGEIYGENLIKPSSTLGTPGVDYNTGFVNLYTDSDGVTRSFIPYLKGTDDNYHFSLMIVGQYLGKIPDLGQSRMLIKYYGLPGDYEYISFSDVYNKKIDISYFDNKIVLIGATAADLHDDVIVPISDKAMPGVEVNANLVQSVLTRDFLYYQDDISAILMVFLFAIIAGILLFRFRIHIATIIILALIIAYILLSIYIFDSGLIMNILYPILSIIIVYIALVILYYLTEERSRKWITSVFGKYVSPVVIETLIKNPDRIRLGGEKRDITIFFSDIRGFTSISERLEPENLVHLLNDYLTEMSSIIIKNQGLVDKYMGDAVMAIWGAPLDQPNHAESACYSSLEMIAKLKELQEKWKKQERPSFEIGIGLNSGHAIVGNMGSSNRFDYTAMGDNVNLASRMEGLNKLYGTNILITQNTYKDVKEKFETRKLDVVRVKGKKKPILIYELLSKKGELEEKQLEFIRLFEAGLESYFEKNWKEAIKTFDKAIKIEKDKASELFISRCQEFLKNPPSKEWDGAWEMKTK